MTKNLLDKLATGEISKPKAILLDWDNTLADSWSTIHKSLNHAFRKFGKDEWSIEDVVKGREGIHHSLRASFPRIFGEDRWEEARAAYFESFLACHLDEITLLDGADKTIRALAETDVFIAIVSNKTGKYLREELTHLDILSYFDKTVGATDAPKDKPFADPIYFALEGLGITNMKDVWMVGDSMTDIEAARNAECVEVLYLNDSNDDLISGVENVISNHAEFLEIAKYLQD